MKLLRHIAAVAVCTFSAAAGNTLWAQYQKTILLEDFSSVTCINCPQAAEIVKKIAKENPQRVLTTQWHLDLPGRNDPFFAANKPHNEARESYYQNGGFNSLPQVFVDGVASVGTNEATVRADVNTALSEESPISITVTQTRNETNDTMKVRVTIQSEDGLPNGYRLYAVAVEGMVHRPVEYFTEVHKSQPYYNETEFRDLFRTFASPAEGVEVVINGNETKTYDYSYAVGAEWELEEMYTIAWVQDEFSRETIQAGSSPKPPSLSVREGQVMAGYSLGLPVPNPVRGTARISLALGNAEQGTLTLHNTLGETAKEISLGRLERGEHQVEVETADLPAGVYTLTLRAGRFQASQTLTVVK